MAVTMVQERRKAKMRVARPAMRNAPPANSSREMKVALAAGNGMPSEVKNWITLSRLFHLPRPSRKKASPRTMRVIRGTRKASLLRICRTICARRCSMSLPWRCLNVQKAAPIMSGFSKNNRVMDRNYEMWSFFTGTAQPPLPLQEFLPAQPLSPDLQPPLPLQEFWPLQSCLAPLTLGGLVSSAMSLDPATIPAVTVPRAIANFLRFIDESLLVYWGQKMAVFLPVRDQPKCWIPANHVPSRL